LFGSLASLRTHHDGEKQYSDWSGCVRVDDRRFAGATSAHDIEMENIISERLEAAKRQIERMR
jgi:hypothetical protein